MPSKKLDLSCQKIKAETITKILKDKDEITEISCSSLSNKLYGFRLIAPHLKSFKYLSKLTLDYNDLNDESLDLIINLLRSNKHIAEISISGHKFTAKAINLLIEFLNKENKSLIEFKLFDSYSSEQKKIDNIINRNKLLRENLREEAYNEGLENCFLSQDDVSIILGEFQKKQAIRNLSFKACEITDESFVTITSYLLGENNAISSLNLSNNNLTDASIDNLEKLLKNNKKLQQINLSANKFTEDGCKRIVDMVCENKILTEFSFNLSPTLQKTLNRKIKRNVYLTKINDPSVKEISFYDISGTELLEILEQGLKDNPNITSASIRIPADDSSIGKAIATYIENNQNLKSLDLSGNDFRANEACLLSLRDALEHNSTLTKLNLSGSKIDDKGAKIIADILKSIDSTIAVLNLTSNSIGHDGILHLAESLEKNRRLTTLLLNDNPIPGTVVTSLGKFLVKNKILKNLHLGSSHIDEASAEHLITILDPSQNKALSAAQRKKTVGNTALIALYISRGTQPFVKILSKIASYVKRNQNKSSELISAVELGQLEEVKKLIECSSLYTNKAGGDTLLHIAVKRRHKNIVDFLLKQGFNKNLCNDAGETPLDIAKNLKNDEIIALLTQSYSITTTTSTIAQVTPLPKKSKKHKDEIIIEATQSIIQQAIKKQKTLEGSLVIADHKTAETETKIIKVETTEDPKPSNSSEAALFDLVATGSLFQLKNLLHQSMVNCKNRSGDTLLHIAVISDQISCAKYLLAQGAELNHKNINGLTPLYLLINDLLEQSYNEQMMEKKFELIHLLIKNGARTDILVSDDELKIKQLTILHKAIAYGHYKLMKLILAAPDCQPNQPDSRGWTALDWAVERLNLEIIDRLLIDRRLTPATISSALAHAQGKMKLIENTVNGTSAIYTITQWLEKRKSAQVPDHPTSGIHWSRQLAVIYGSRYKASKKTVAINAEKKHAQLTLQNVFCRQRLFNPEVASTEDKIKDFPGNPVTASLVFIVSTERYKRGEHHERQKIWINLDFIGEYHVNDLEDHGDPDSYSEQVKQRIIQRIEAAPDDIFMQESSKKYPPLNKDEIEQLFKAQLLNNDPNYRLAFHHGEQALLNALEEEKTIENIIAKLLQEPKINQGCKIYGVILNIHSPRYVCENCEAAILGVQNSARSLFLQRLCKKLTQHGYIIPHYSPLRMTTLVSSYIPYHSEQVSQAEHQLFTVDMRECNNMVILSKDLSVFDSSFTQHHSSKFKY